MKKIIALLCVVAMIISLCGCGGTVEEVESTVEWTEGGQQNEVDISNDSDENSGDISASSNTGSNGASDGSGNIGSGNSNIKNPLDVDLKGATITIYDTGMVFSPDASASKTNQAKAEMLKKIQKELNCKFKIVSTTVDKLESYVTNSAASGKALCGIITPPMYDSGFYISANLVTNFTKVSSIDLSKNYMNRYGILSASQFGSAKYAVAAEGETRTHVVYFNKRILKEIGYSENYIYDLVDSGKWTYDVYRDLAKKAMKDLDGKAGMSGDDQWGQVVQDDGTQLMSNVVVSYGTTMLKLGSDGSLKNNMTDPKIINAANLANEVIVKDGTKYELGADADKVNFFAAGKTLFLYADIGKAMSISSMKDEFGIAPAPQVSASKKYVSAIDWNSRVLMMPAGLSAQDQYNAGAVIQAYQYLYEDVLDAMEKEWTNRYLCDEKSAANWRIAANDLTTMPQQLYSQTNESILSGTYRIFWDYFHGKSTSPATNIQSTKSVLDTTLVELNNKIKDK